MDSIYDLTQSQNNWLDDWCQEREFGSQVWVPKLLKKTIGIGEDKIRLNSKEK